MHTLDTSSLIFQDVQLDYYGRRAAAACGAPVQPNDAGMPDGNYTVQIWDITDGQQRPLAQLQGHEGPIWKVAWAHPKFGSLLATCGYDMKVIVWKEINGQWQQAYIDNSHSASVNDIEFCPWEHGLRLACASSDGSISVLTYEANQGQWLRSSFPAHICGAQSVSWASVRGAGHAQLPMRLASGGCDSKVLVWKCEVESWTQDGTLMRVHEDWVRKVAWRPDGTSTLASGSWDKTVVIWRQEVEGHPWRQLSRLEVDGKVEGLAWSVTGSILAVSLENGSAVLFRESDDGRSFEEAGKCSEQGYTEITKANSVSLDPRLSNNLASVADASVDMTAQQQAVLDSFGMGM